MADAQARNGVTYYKAVRGDGTDFYAGTVHWVPEDGTYPHTVTHPTSTEAIAGDHSTSLAVSTDPTRLPGASWPMRLLTVEASDAPVIETHEHNKRQAVAWVVTGEVEAHLRFGPQGVHVAALIEAMRTMTPEQARTARAAARDAAWDAARYAARDAAWYAARAAARDAAWDAAWYAARDAAWYAARTAAWDAAWDAAMALTVRDLISTEHYLTLTRPLRLTGVTVHPDDPKATR